MLGMIRGRFDRWAPGYDSSLLQRLIFEPVHREVLDAFDAHAIPPKHVLDVGCGTGRLLERAADRWPEARLTGVDVSNAMIAEAQRKHEGDARFTLVQGTASALAVDSEACDAVFSTMSFHHWGDQVAGLREVSRVLRSGSLFVLADMDAPLLFLSGPVMHWVDGSRMRAPRDIDRMFERAGFAVLMHRRIRTISRQQVVVGRKR